MDKYQQIIVKGRVSLSDFGLIFLSYGSNIMMILVSLWGLYYVNNFWYTDDEPNKVLFGNILVSFLGIFSLLSILLSWSKLKVKFYDDKRTLEKKYQIVEMQKRINHWKCKKQETNYFLFYENNVILPSYYITIVFDEKGFYLNCFPSLSNVWDFGRSQKWCDQLFEEMQNRL